MKLDSSRLGQTAQLLHLRRRGGPEHGISELTPQISSQFLGFMAA
jgi:hypothetical protein